MNTSTQEHLHLSTMRPPRAHHTTATTCTYFPSLDVLRALSAIGIMLTHVAFLTGIDPTTRLGALCARFDLFVAVFFSLSGFLLWTRYASDSFDIFSYYRARAHRILPPFFFTLACAFFLFPPAFGTSLRTMLLTATFTQIYAPAALAQGLTHLWSLSVEIAFYVLLPLIIFLCRRFRQRGRILFFCVLSLVGYIFPFLPPFVHMIPDDATPNPQLFPLAFLPWFSVGILLALLRPHIHFPRWATPLCWIASILFLIAISTPDFSPTTLTHPTTSEFFHRILAGTLCSAAVLAPLVLCPPLNHSQCRILRILLSSLRILGDCSYEFFLLHLMIVTCTFELLGIPLFSGSWWDFLRIALVGGIASGCSAWCVRVLFHRKHS